MSNSAIHRYVNYFIALVWVVNGLWCKVLNMVPRHQEIVGSILGNDFSRELTVLIGLSEILMAIWILSKLYSRLNVLVQLVVIGSMNVLEFLLVPDLLLWGKANSLFALAFMGLIYLNEFRFKPATT